MKRPDAAAVTNLEGAILAVIARDGAATPYALAREFARSPAEFWSGSAGAIYPLIKRLEARGLVSGQAAATGRRKANVYAVTPAGRGALERWLLDDERAADMGFDPLRTRLPFLGLVSAQQRARLLAAVTERTIALQRSDAFAGQPEAEVNRSWLKSRLNWLKALRR